MMVYEKFTYPYVRRSLRKRYPKKMGWEIHIKDDPSNAFPDFLVERRTRKGFIERVIVEVKKATRITRQHVDQLNSYARHMAGENVRVVNKIMVVPSGSDVEKAPGDISIIQLRKFWCMGDRIIHEI